MEGVSYYQREIAREESLKMIDIPENLKILFYSEDGQNFKLFIEGKEIAATRGVQIFAGDGEPITVTPNIVLHDSVFAIKDES